jgi:crotonobetainyl-CoA:carnitine CoA-transferase CaiB-like acyl-CoA transferase
MDETVVVCEAAGISFSPVVVREDLFDDPHLRAREGLIATMLPNGVEAALPRPPITVADTDLGSRNNPPAIGRDTHDILEKLG